MTVLCLEPGTDYAGIAAEITGRLSPESAPNLAVAGPTSAAALFIPEQHEETMTATKEVSAQRLKSFIQRIERLETEKAALAADIREVYAESKSAGYDPKIMRIVIKLRKMDAADREEMDSLTQVYADAVGL